MARDGRNVFFEKTILSDHFHGYFSYKNFKNAIFAFHFENMQINHLELFAALLGIVSVWYARKENILVFPFGIANVAIYIYICFVSQLYANAGINAIYLISNVYGWHMWSRTDEGNNTLRITSNSRRQNIAWALASLALYGIIVWVLRASNASDSEYLSSPLSWIDALNTSFFLCATILMAFKKVENWAFWIGGNIISIPIYFSQGLYFTGIQYSVFLVLAIMGLSEWRRKSLGNKKSG